MRWGILPTFGAASMLGLLLTLNTAAVLGSTLNLTESSVGPMQTRDDTFTSTNVVGGPISAAEGKNASMQQPVVLDGRRMTAVADAKATLSIVAWLRAMDKCTNVAAWKIDRETFPQSISATSDVDVFVGSIASAVKCLPEGTQMRENGHGTKLIFAPGMLGVHLYDFIPFDKSTGAPLPNLSTIFSDSVPLPEDPTLRTTSLEHECQLRSMETQKYPKKRVKHLAWTREHCSLPSAPRDWAQTMQVNLLGGAWERAELQLMIFWNPQRKESKAMYKKALQRFNGVIVGQVVHPAFGDEKVSVRKITEFYQANLPSGHVLNGDPRGQHPFIILFLRIPKSMWTACKGGVSARGQAGCPPTNAFKNEMREGIRGGSTLIHATDNKEEVESNLLTLQIEVVSATRGRKKSRRRSLAAVDGQDATPSRRKSKGRKRRKKRKVK
jgi:hypothetical protein